MEPILYLLYITWKIFTMQNSYNFAEAEDEAYSLTVGMKKKLRFNSHIAIPLSSYLMNLARAPKKYLDLNRTGKNLPLLDLQCAS